MSEITIKAIGDADVVSASNGSLNVNIPIKITRRGRRKVVPPPEGSTMPPGFLNQRTNTHSEGKGRGGRYLRGGGTEQGGDEGCLGQDGLQGRNGNDYDGNVHDVYI